MGANRGRVGLAGPARQHDKDALLSPGELKRWLANIVDNEFAVCHVCLRAWRRVPGKRYFETSPQLYRYHRSVMDMHTVICPECAASELEQWVRGCARARADKKGRVKAQKLYRSERGLD